LSTPTTTQVVQALQQQDWTTVRSLLPETPYSVYVDAETLITTPHDIYTLIVRTRKEGDRIQPLGMNQEKKIKEVLINRHIPRDERERIPLFFLDTPGGHCIWLGGIQLDHRVRLTPHTRSIICLSLTSNTAVDSITP
jgi:tRNA(Ile)-lysidine synthase